MLAVGGRQIMRIGPFGVWEIMIILIVVLLIFGPKRLPEMAKGLGQSVRAFRKELRDIKEDFSTDDWDDAPPQRRAAKPAAAQPGRPGRAVEPAEPDEAPAASAPAAGPPVTGEDEAGARRAEPSQRREFEEPVNDRRA
jgi:sec-independent protein translocase protein TatA